MRTLLASTESHDPYLGGRLYQTGPWSLLSSTRWLVANGAIHTFAGVDSTSARAPALAPVAPHRAGFDTEKDDDRKECCE